MKKGKQFKTKKASGKTKKFSPLPLQKKIIPVVTPKYHSAPVNVTMLEDPIKRDRGCDCWTSMVEWQPKGAWNREIFMYFSPMAQISAVVCPKTDDGRFMHIKVTETDGTCYCVDVQCIGLDKLGNLVSYQQDYCINCHRVVCRRELEFIPKTPICWVKHC